MAYQTYITDALVCGVNNSNTSDRSYLLFTREAGMLFASARSVRRESSKQRYALQEFSLVRVSLIKGKSGWRIGSVESTHNYYDVAHDKEARGSVVNIIRQLRRFVHGEANTFELFEFVLDALNYVQNSISERNFLDEVIKLRILHKLGYVSEKNIQISLLNTDLEELHNIHNGKLVKELDKAVKQAVSASHL